MSVCLNGVKLAITSTCGEIHTYIQSPARTSRSLTEEARHTGSLTVYSLNKGP